MRAIHRDIVGAFIFSSDGKILLGHNRKSGVYQDQLVVPGGGVEEGETKPEALRREMLEETGIDIARATVTEIGVSSGESEKTLQDTNETVLVKMTFYDFKVELPTTSASTQLIFQDDYGTANWYTAADLAGKSIGLATRNTLAKLHFIE